MRGYIYSIKNKVNNKVYIGITINFRLRKNSHLHMLRKNIHHSPGLQNAFNLYGEEAFYFEFIEVNVESYEDLCQLEIDTIEKHNSFIHGYNGTRGGDMPPSTQKYEDEDLLNCLCILFKYNDIGKTLEEILEYSKGTMSRLKLRKCYASVWDLYSNLTEEERDQRAETWYTKWEVKEKQLSRQMRQGGCSKAYQLTQDDYNLAFTLREHGYGYTQVGEVLEIKPATVKDWFNGRSRKKEYSLFLQLSEKEKQDIYCRFKTAELSGEPKS